MKIRTLQAVALSAAVMSLAACAKDDDSSGPNMRQRVTSALLPVPSCDDSSDDGSFEVWNSSEDSLMFNRTQIVLPGTAPVPGSVSDIRLHLRRIPIRGGQIQWSADMQGKDYFSMVFSIVDPSTGMVEAEAREELSGRTAMSPPGRESYNSELEVFGTLSPGCKRLYYNARIPRFRVPSPHARLVDTLIILNRGHFDVELY